MIKNSVSVYLITASVIFPLCIDKDGQLKIITYAVAMMLLLIGCFMLE